MKKILLLILAAGALLLAALAVIIHLQPSEFRVERSAVVAAPPEAVFPHVNSLRRWEAWSPWAKLDPQSKVEFSGPEEGAGACMAWAGNREVGVGSLTITDSRPSGFIAMRLDFVEPMAGTSTVDFRFEPVEGGTRVTWSMAGTNNFLAKAIGLFIDCDQMIGGMYEQGLANLKRVAETPAP